jgi:magnesium transporter
VQTTIEPVRRELARAMAIRHPEDAARVLENASVDEAVEFLQALGPQVASNAIRGVTPDFAARLLAEAPGDLARQWITAWNPNRAASAIARLDAADRDRVLSALDPRDADDLRSLMAYPPGSAGALMDTRVVTFRPETPVREVVRKLRSLRERRIQDVFLVDAEGHLRGSVSLQAVVLAGSQTPLGSLASGDTPRVQGTSSQDEVLDVMATHRAMSLPVVDFDDHVLGVLRQEQLVKAAQQDAMADLAKMVGASAEERALSAPMLSVRKRLPWLQINLLTAFLAAAVVGLFEDTIAKFTALAVLLPVVAGQSGNTGSQALAVTMRGLALREIRVKHAAQVAWKEMRVGAMNGVAVALTTSLAVWFWSGSFGLAAVIAVSMVLSMTLAGLSGACIPMLLTTLKQDPAQSSSIILTTVTDVVGFMSFLGIATLFSRAL